jgi:hypothetical protein
MKLLLESWKRYIAESHDLSNIAMDINDIASETPEDSKLAVKEYLYDNNYTIVGIGQGRVIVRLDSNTVGKIAYNQNGIEQNKQEWITWNKTKSDLLVPVVDKANDYMWITSEYAQVCGEACEVEIGKRKNIVKKELASAGIGSLIDVHNLMNWGIHNGEVKLLDYGS